MTPDGEADGGAGREAREPRGAAVLALAAVAGAGTMTVELAAVRLLAPWFGTSLVVWTNVIGVVLLALALGYLAGGRLARRPRPLAVLGGALVLGGAATAVLPALVGPVAGLSLPEALALDEAADLVLWGSLLSSLLLFLVPAALLGTVPPLAVEAVERARPDHGDGSAGRAGGVVLCGSTLGSLVGVFGTSHVFVPELGLRATFAGAGAVLFIAGLVALLLARAGPARVLGAVVLGGLAGAAGARSAAAPRLAEGWTLLAARESAYQSVRVVEDPGWGADGSSMRHLQVNEAFDSFQSVWQPEPGLLPEGFYYNLFALPLLWEPPAGGAARVLVLGLGGGTAWRVLAGAVADTELDLAGVELDPVVVELAREHLELAPDGARHRVAAGVDARVALRGVEAGTLDYVVLDCYANQVEIPAHLATVEFFREVRARLAPGGWLAANLGGFGFDDPVVEAVAATCAAAFEADVLVVRVPSARNFVLFARAGGGLPVRTAETGEPSLPPAPEWARWCFAPLEVPGAFRVVARGDGRVLTDDANPIDVLQLESIRHAREREAGA